ncbi:MAG: ERF family protein, partial [Gemmatimonadaceae bacterium]|nr:ERF family protein [Gemmatimonadaceae bacterium]
MSYTPPLEGFKPSLFRKIAEVQGEIHAMRPDETVSTGTYSFTYISESQLLEAVRKKLSDRKVAAFVSVDSQHTDVVESQRQRNDGSAYTVTTAMSEIVLRIVFADGESGETFTIFGQGRAHDAGDKSVYKAITSANRYAWWKTMLVPTGDDDVNKDSGEAGTAGPVQA